MLNVDSQIAALSSAHLLRVRLLQVHSDGRKGADIACASVGYPFVAPGYRGTPYNLWYTLDGVGQNVQVYSIHDVVNMLNAQVGLSATPAATVITITSIPPEYGTSPYPANPYGPALYAVFLTLDGLGQPAPIQTDMSNATLVARPFYQFTRRYYGQVDRMAYIVKRVGGSVQGLVTTDRQGATLPTPTQVTVVPTSGFGQPSQIATTDANGFFLGRGLYPCYATVGNGYGGKSVYVPSRAWAPIDLRRYSGTLINPTCLSDRISGYLRAQVSPIGEGVRFFRSDYAVPGPWALAAVTITDDANARNPSLAYDRQGSHRLFCVFDTTTGTPGVYEVYSDDDGATWSMPEIALTGCTHPRVETSKAGDKLIVGYNSGNLQAIFQALGDPSPSDVFTLLDNTGTALSAADDTLDLTAAPDRSGRWVLTFCVLGEGDASEWWSADQSLQYWTRATTA